MHATFRQVAHGRVVNLILRAIAEKIILGLSIAFLVFQSFWLS